MKHPQSQQDERGPLGLRKQQLMDSVLQVPAAHDESELDGLDELDGVHENPLPVYPLLHVHVTSLVLP